MATNSTAQTAAKLLIGAGTLLATAVIGWLINKEDDVLVFSGPTEATNLSFGL